MNLKWLDELFDEVIPRVHGEVGREITIRTLKVPFGELQVTLQFSIYREDLNGSKHTRLEVESELLDGQDQELFNKITWHLKRFARYLDN